MNALLRTETLSFLNAFRQRRSSLLWTRGICNGIATAAALLTLLAILDWSVLIPDGIRWSLSLAAYGLAFIMAWWTSLRHLATSRSDWKAAILVQDGGSDLGEELLSAVELGQSDSLDEAHHDSLEFRSQLQDEVARKVERVELSALLPFEKVGRAIAALSAILLVLAGLWFVPWLNFAAHFQRAALPFLNLARPTNLQLIILQPSPADAAVASGQELSIVIETLGERPDRVELELVDPDHGPTRTEMRREELNRFASRLTIEHDIKYRIRSGNTLSKFHSIRALPRPTITGFEKTYRYPEYSGLEPVKEFDEEGHVSAVEGSVVGLRMESNLPVDQAELHLEATDQSDDKVIALNVESDGKTLTGDLPISRDYVAYRVRLRSRDSKIDNRFDPLYEIRGTPDLAPLVRLVNPAEDREVVQDESLTIEAIVRDDYGVTSISKVWKVDAGPWQSEPLTTVSGSKEVTVREPWKLEASSFAVGSILTMKLSATDGAGNVAESSSVRLFIRRKTTADENQAWSQTQARLAKQLSDVERLANRARDAVNKAEPAIRKPAAERNSSDKMAITKAVDMLQQADDEQELLRESLKQAIRQAPTRSDEEELLAIGRMLSEAKRRTSEPALEDMLQLASGGEPPPRDNHYQVRHRANEMAGKIGHAARLLRQLAAAEQGLEIPGQARRLAERQNRITEAAKLAHEEESNNENALKATQEQQAFNEQASKNLQHSLSDIAELADAERGRVEGLKRHLEHREQDLARHREHQERHDKSPATKKQLENAQRLQDTYRHAEREAEQLAKRLDEQAHRARDELLRHALTATPGLHQATHEASRLRDALRNSGKRPLKDDEKKRQAKAKQQFVENTKAAALQLRDNAELQESRKHATHQSASDQSLLARALEAQAREIPEDYEQAKQFSDRMNAIEQARKSLEADNQARELAKSISELSRGERKSGADKKRSLPDDWQVAQKRLEKLPATLREAGVDRDVAKRSEETSRSRSAREISKEMERRKRESRSTTPKPTGSVERALSDLADRTREPQNAAQAAAAEAREQLRKLIPSMSDRMRELADDLNEQSNRNRQLAEQTETKAADTNKIAEAADEMADRNEASLEKLNNLQDDLRREANARNLANAEARERARDADDALAKLNATKASERSSEAQAALQRASQTAPSGKRTLGEQAKALASASSKQSDLAKQLSELGEKLADNARGRNELRAGEVDNPIDESLAKNYERAKELSEQLNKADKAPEDIMAMLENELKKNPSMQRALRDIQDDAAQNAIKQLKNADSQEKKLDSQIQKLADQDKDAPKSADNQQSGINDNVSDASEKLARASRHAKRLGLPDAAKSLQASSQNASDTAKQELEQARASLSENGSAADSMDKVSAASKQLGQVAKAAEQALSQALKSTAQQNSQAAANSAASENEQAEGRALAQALDQLDQALHNQPEPNSASTAAKNGKNSNSRSPQSPSPTEQSTAQAKESFAEALQSLANAMAGNRKSQQQRQRQSGQPQPSNDSQNAERTAAQNPTSGESQFGKHEEDQSNAEDARAQGLVGSDPRRWGDLPKQMAEEAFQSRDDVIAPEYRQSIESYYKALSEKLRERR